MDVSSDMGGVDEMEDAFPEDRGSNRSMSFSESSDIQYIGGLRSPFKVGPWALLGVFTWVSILTYADRGGMAACLGDMSKDFMLSGTKEGIVGGAYLIGYTLSSPIFAHYANIVPPMYLMFGGLSVWVLAVIGSGLSIGFWTLMIARTLTGIGEASFIVLSAPTIFCMFDKKQRPTALAVFYSSIPVGYALGMVMGGVWLTEASHIFPPETHAPSLQPSLYTSTPYGPDMMYLYNDNYYATPNPTTVGPTTMGVTTTTTEDTLPNPWGFKIYFFAEAAIMIPTIIACLFIGGPENMLELKKFSGEPETEEDRKGHQSFWTEVSELLSNTDFMLITAAYTNQTFVVGAFAYYGMSYVENVYPVTDAQAGIAFGLSNVLSGIFGTLGGGVMLDYIKNNYGHKPSTEYRTQDQSERDIEQALLDEESDLDSTTSEFSTDEEEEDENLDATVSATNAFLFWLSLLSVPAAVGAFLTNSTTLFFIFLTITEFCIFMTLSPINSAIMWITPHRLRSLACGVSVIFIHVLGDGISPLILGSIGDAIYHKTGNTVKAWRLAMSFSVIFLVTPLIFFFLGWKKAKDRMGQAKVKYELN